MEVISFADIRTSANTFKQQMHSYGLQVVSEEDISENVRRAIELEESIKQKRIQENIPAWLQTIFKQFAGVKGSKADTNLEIGKLVYYSVVLRKQVEKKPC